MGSMEDVQVKEQRIAGTSDFEEDVVRAAVRARSRCASRLTDGAIGVHQCGI